MKRSTVTMVKKRLADGSACPKCDDAQRLLESRGRWEAIDRVVWADVNEPGSEGWQLARQHEVDLAPFFVVETDGVQTVVKSVIQLLRLLDELPIENAWAEPADPEAEVARPPASPMAVVEPPPSALEGGLEAVRWALTTFGADCAIAFSGAEDVVLIDLAAQTGLPYSVITLDTGRLHPDTLAYLDRVRAHYGFTLEVAFPDAQAVSDLVRRKGTMSFMVDGHHECCAIRKVAPLARALGGKRAWMTGLRADQSPATRADLPIVESDPKHKAPDGAPLVKVNPLVRWTSADVWRHLRDHDVPTNPLHLHGYRSIGCAPCTRPVHPGQHEREGRWWWEEATHRECGLHLK